METPPVNHPVSGVKVFFAMTPDTLCMNIRSAIETQTSGNSRPAQHHKLAASTESTFALLLCKSSLSDTCLLQEH